MAKRLRLMLVIARMNVGGPAYCVSNIAGRLDPDRFDTVLVHGRLGHDEGSFEFLADQEHCHVVPLPELAPEISPVSDVRALHALRSLMTRYRPDVVNTHTAKAGFAGRLAAATGPGPRPAIVHTYHGHVLEGYFGARKTALYRGLERRLATVSDALIGVSDATVADLVRLGVAERDRFRVVHCGVDLDRFTKPDPEAVEAFRRRAGVRDGELLLDFVGRVVPIKRVDVLLRAFALLCDDGLPLRLAVVGDGEARPHAERLAAELGVADRVTFTGFIDDPVAATAAADIAVLSSDNEGTPVALIEAAAAGRPAVATAVGGVPEVVARSGAPLVPAGDHEALAAGIRSLAGDADERARIGMRAREHVLAHFSVSAMLAGLTDVYEGVAAQRQSPRPARTVARPVRVQPRVRSEMAVTAEPTRGTGGAGMRYLITGGAGFIGSHVVDGITGRGDAVVILDDFSTGRLENIHHVLDSDRVELVEGSMLDAALVDDLVSRTDATIHLASAVGVQLVVSHPLDSLKRNIRGNDNVISAAAEHGRPLLFASTSEVYGKNSTGALHEDSDRVLGSIAKLRWSYATAKAFGEALAYSYVRDQGARMTVARLFNTVGPRQTGAYGMVLPRFVRQALTGEDLTVYGDGNQSRCFGHVYDVVGGLLQLVDHEGAVGRPFNIGAPIETKIVELARRVIERTKSSSKIALVPYEEAYGDGFEELGRRQPDTSALQALTGWKPTRTVDDAIDDVVAHVEARELPLQEGLRLVG